MGENFRSPLALRFYVSGANATVARSVVLLSRQCEVTVRCVGLVYWSYFDPRLWYGKGNSTRWGNYSLWQIV